MSDLATVRQGSAAAQTFSANAAGPPIKLFITCAQNDAATVPVLNPDLTLLPRRGSALSALVNLPLSALDEYAQR